MLNLEILIKKFTDRKLSPFYILKKQGNVNLLNIIDSFIQDILQKEGFPKKYKSNDVIILSKESYQVDNFTFLFKLDQFKPIELPWRFVIIDNAHQLSDTILNKLLKTLEDPPVNTSIFFLDQEDVPFIPTIIDRAIIIRLGTKKINPPHFITTSDICKKFFLSTLSEELQKKTVGFLKAEIGINDFLAFLRKYPNFELEFFKRLIITETEMQSSFLDKHNFLESMHLYHQALNYHTGITEKFMAVAFNQLSRFDTLAK